MFNKNNISKIWWLSLTIISLINIYVILLQYKNSNNKKLFILAFIYVIVNAYRAIWPRIDIERICFFDTKLSTPLIGRFFATIAELCYIKLFIIVLKKIIIKTKYYNYYNVILNIVFICIVIAEILSWCGCLSKYQLFNAFEEILWALSAFIIIIICIFSHKDIKNNKYKNYLLIIAIFCIIYFIFMIFIDIPMYIKRNKKIIINKKDSLKDQIKDMNKCYKITKNYNIWKEEIPWLSGYFSFGSWSAILLLILYNKN